MVPVDPAKMMSTSKYGGKLVNPAEKTAPHAPPYASAQSAAMGTPQNAANADVSHAVTGMMVSA